MPFAQALTSLAISCLILVWMISFQLRQRRVRPNRLWLLPVLTLLYSLSTFSNDSRYLLATSGIVAILIGLGLGACLGTWRSTFYAYEAHDSDGLLIKGTPMTVAFWLIPLFVRLFVVTVAHQNASLQTLSLLLLGVSLGNVTAARIGIYQRYRQHTMARNRV